jgi:hypothetical protein
MWIPLKKYCEKYEWPSKIATLRVIIWNVEKGLGRQPSFIHRYGKRVLIDGEMFQAWLTTKEAADAKKASTLMAKEKRMEKLGK